jgi:chitinase
MPKRVLILLGLWGLLFATVVAHAVYPAATATPSPFPTPLPVNGDCRHVLAYYTSWSKPAYSAANIPYAKLTHICHAFLLPGADGSLPVPSGFLEANLIPSAHAQGVKVLVSVGGASGSANFSTIAADAVARANFVAQVKAFLLANSYDGVDLDWEFPQSSADRDNLTALVQALRTGFSSAPNAHPEWLISGAYSWTTYYGQYYDLAALTPLVDFFNLMTYDFHGPWSSVSGHNAPLYPPAGDSSGDSTMGALDYFITTRGVPASKINFGLPFYGYDFPTKQLNDPCPNCATATVTYPYATIQGLIGHGWTRVWDASAESPYLSSDTDAHVISYDDPQSIQAKADYALNARGVAGVFMWDISMDDLGAGVQPLLDAMRSPMSCGPTYTPTATPTPVVFTVPGRVQAENYSSYLNLGPGNYGSNIEATTDVGGGYDVGWTVAGEWLDYSINVAVAGTYDVTLRTAVDSGSSQVELKLDGAALGPPLSLPMTGGWQNWANVVLPGMAFTAGPHTLRVQVDTAGFNLNYIDVEPPATPTPSATLTPTLGPPTSTPTASPTLTPAPPTATFSPSPGQGPLVVSACVPVPNPGPRSFSIHLEGPADEADLDLYDQAMRCVLRVRQRDLSRGWNQVALPESFKRSANGTYFFRLSARRGAQLSAPVSGRLVLLR